MKNIFAHLLWVVLLQSVTLSLAAQEEKSIGELLYKKGKVFEMISDQPNGSFKAARK